ncbi:MAG: hypothetical protein MJ131_03660 [Lachnospiraceae bacterium]|nr:hypothetical protein [Lachnospiraceae bacterium]
MSEKKGESGSPTGENMFGVKIKTVKTNVDCSIEEFYELIKDKTFSAGQPSLTKHGFANVITFPALDRNNQVWIMKGGKNKWSIQKQEEAGVGNAVKNAALDGLTKGWSSIGGMFGSKAKEAEKLVEATASELEALGL